MIRLKVFIPSLLIVALAAFTAIFLVDGWLKNAIESAISAGTQTKTDITQLKLSFLNSSLKIKRLEIASRDDDFKNAVEFEDIIIDFQTLPLLKKRVVVDEFSIKGIKWGTKRSRSGRLPINSKAPESSTWLSDFKAEAIDRIKTEFDHMPLSQFTDFRIPSDPTEIFERFELKSLDAFKGVITHTQEMKGRWVEKMKEIRDTRALEAKIKDVRALSRDIPSNPQEILARIQKAEESIEFFKKEEKRLTKYVNDVKSDALKIQADYKVASDVLEADFEKAKSMVSLDQLKLDNISRLLFGPEVLKQVEQVLRAHAWMRQMLASNSKADDVQVRQRAKGRDIIFVTQKKAPGFVLAKSEFSVKGIEGGDRNRLAQLYELKLKDINSSPKVYGKPSSVDFRGEFKDAALSDAIFSAFWDYTKTSPVDEFKVEARKIKAENWPMGIPQFFPLKIEAGLANAKSDLRFEGDLMKSISKFDFSNIVWNFKDIPRQGMIVDILQKVFERIKNFNFEVELKSKGDDFDFEIRSDLDVAVRTAVQDEIQKRLSEFQARLKLELQNRVAKLQSEANRLTKEFQTEFETQVDAVLKQAVGYQNEVDRIKDEIKHKGERQAADKIKDVLPSGNDTLKKLKKLF